MKHLEKIKVIFFGLSLLLSLVSFSNGSNQHQPTVIKTELVVKEKIPNSRFTIKFHSIGNVDLESFIPSGFSFFTFIKYHNNTVFTAILSYKNENRSSTTEQLQTELYRSLNQKILYEHIS